MTLMEELKERWSAIFLERESVEKRADELAEDMQELEVALAALQSLHNPIADEQPELFDEPQEIEASSQSESCVPALGAETDLQASPGEAEESRDHSDDVSEFGDPDEPAEHISILTGDPAIEPESGLHDSAGPFEPKPWSLITAFRDGFEGRKQIAPDHHVYMEEYNKGARAAGFEAPASEPLPVTKPYRVIADEDYVRVTYDFATMAEATACYDEFAAKPITRVDLYVLHEDGHGLQEWVKHSSFCKPASLVEAEQTREPPAMEGVAFVDGKWTIPGPSFEELDDDGLEPGPVDEASHPMASYVPATDPKADALAKAADYYSPENVAERNRFDPFRMFKRETEET